MTSDGPKERLRKSREAQKLSREALAKILGWSASTIRAHETGQNQIRPDAAAAYRDALGITPAWLLYGTPEEAPDFSSLTGRFVDVVGEVWDNRHFAPVDELASKSSLNYRIHISEADNLGPRLSAYVARGEQWNDRRKKHYIVRQFSAKGTLALLKQLVPGDELVIQVTEGRLSEIAVWQFGKPDPDRFTFFRGPNETEASAILKLEKSADVLQTHIKGLVVGTVTHRTIWPESDEEDDHDDRD